MSTNVIALVIGGVVALVALLSLLWKVYMGFSNKIDGNFRMCMDAISGKGKKENPGSEWYNKQAQALGEVKVTCDFLRESVKSLKENTDKGLGEVHQKLSDVDGRLRTLNGNVEKSGREIAVIGQKLEGTDQIAREAKGKVETLGSEVAKLKRNKS